jgi:hypothetical protein
MVLIGMEAQPARAKARKTGKNRISTPSFYLI